MKDEINELSNEEFEENFIEVFNSMMDYQKEIAKVGMDIANYGVDRFLELISNYAKNLELLEKYVEEGNKRNAFDNDDPENLSYEDLKQIVTQQKETINFAKKQLSQN